MPIISLLLRWLHTLLLSGLLLLALGLLGLLWLGAQLAAASSGKARWRWSPRSTD